MLAGSDRSGASDRALELDAKGGAAEMALANGIEEWFQQLPYVIAAKRIARHQIRGRTKRFGCPVRRWRAVRAYAAAVRLDHVRAKSVVGFAMRPDSGIRSSAAWVRRK